MDRARTIDRSERSARLPFWRVGWLGAALALAACADPHLIRVEVQGAPQDATVLAMAVEFDGRYIGRDLELLANGRPVWLRPPPGVSGKLHLTFEAQGEDRCAMALAERDVDLAAEPTEEVRLTVQLQLLSPAKQCPLRIRTSGLGTGALRVVGAEAPLPARGRLAAGREIVLEAIDGDGSHFGGWLGACEGHSRRCRLTPTGPMDIDVRFNRGLCTGGEFCWESPLPQGNQLRGLYRPPGGAELWAVGDAGTVLRKVEPGAWRALLAPTQQDLVGISGSGPGDLWLVGARGAVAHFDGKALELDTPTSSPTGLTSVYARQPGVVWAIGPQDTVVVKRGGIWGTSRFNDMPQNRLARRLFGIGADPLFAVGSGGLVARYNGDFWTSGTAPTPGVLYGVHGLDAQTAFAVGEGGVALRWDAAAMRWIQETTMPGPDLSAVYAAAQDQVYAVGSGPSLWRRTNGTWQQQMTTVPPELAGAALRDVLVAPPSTLWAVGERGALLRGDATRLDPDDDLLEPGDSKSGAPRGTLYATAVVAADDAWAVGAKGLILRWDGTRWRREPAVDDMQRDLLAVWATAEEAWAVGAAGRVLRWRRGGTWQIVEGPVGTPLYAVSGDRDLVYVAGKGGALYSARRSGGSWLKQTFTGEDINALWADGAGGLWTAGVREMNFGNVYKVVGASQKPYSLGSGIRFAALSGTSPDDLWAAGDGVVAHFVQGTWTEVPIAGVSFSGLWAGPSGAWAVGDGGVVYRVDPTGKALRTESGARPALRGVAGAVVTGRGGRTWEDVLIVGETGAILRWTPVGP